MFRIAQIAALAAAILVATQLLVVLYAGEFTIGAYLFDNVALSVIYLLALLLFSIVLKHKFNLREAFNSRQLFIVFSLSLIVYLANDKTLAVGDTMSGRYLPFSILREGNFDFDEFTFLFRREIPYWIQRVKGHYVSWYPIGSSLLSTPFYIPSALGTVDPAGRLPLKLEKLSASTLTALSVVIVYLTLRRVARRKTTLWLTAAYAFGTCSLSVCSQALWQHCPSQLCIGSALYCLVRGGAGPQPVEEDGWAVIGEARNPLTPGNAKWIGYAAAPLALSVVCRPFDLIVALPLCLYVAIHQRTQFFRFLLFGLPVAVFQLAYNRVYWGTFMISQGNLAASNNWDMPMAPTLAGLLFSPARGLFVYSPFLLFLLPAVVIIWKSRNYVLYKYLCAGVIATILAYSKWKYWVGGFSFGPRFFADLSPAFVLMLTPLERWWNRRKAALILFAFLAGLSIAAHAIGAFLDDRYWNLYMRDNYDFAWRWNDNQLVNPVRRLYTRACIRMTGLPTSENPQNLLSAEYSTSLPETLRWHPTQIYQFDLNVTNTGKAAFLAWPYSVPGCTYVEWHWEKGGKPLVRTSDDLRLRNDLLPGETQGYTITIKAPEKPGIYTLVLGLIQSGTPLSDIDGPSIRVPSVVK